MKAIARPFTDEEKARMIKIVDKIHDLLQPLKSPMMSAFITQLVNQAVQEDAGIAKVAMVKKDGKTIVDLGDRVNRTRQILEQMNQSSVNLILYDNCHEVWMQYYMGKFFSKPTLILVSDERYEEFKAHELEEEVMIIKDFNNIDQKELNDKLMKVSKDE